MTEEEGATSSESLPTTHLCDDFYYIIAEHLFFNRDYGNGDDKFKFTEIDMCAENMHTNFMSLCMATRIATLSQFAKMRRIEFSHLGGKEYIRMHKNEEASFCCFGNPEFKGPYLVNKEFVFGALIQSGKFRATHIKSTNYLETIPFQKIEDYAGKTNLQVFCELFLGKDLPTTHERNCPMIRSLEIDESKECINERLEQILAVNAQQLKFSIFRNILIFDCSNKARNIVAENTNEITVSFRLGFEPFEDDHHKLVEDWKSMLDYFAQSCPNLLKIKFDLNTEFISPNEFCNNLHSIAEKIAKMLGQLSAGTSALNVQINLTASCEIYIYEDLPQNDHKLFKLGESHLPENMVDNEDPFVARKVDVTDAVGRSHQFCFCISSEEIGTVYNDDMSGVGYDYDGYGPDLYDFEDDYPDCDWGMDEVDYDPDYDDDY